MKSYNGKKIQLIHILFCCEQSDIDKLDEKHITYKQKPEDDQNKFTVYK
jgi:hypothetical protein